MNNIHFRIKIKCPLKAQVHFQNKNLKSTTEVHYTEKNTGMFSYKNLISLQLKTTRLHNIANQTGLNIITTKTQVMYVHQSNWITVDGSPLVMVEEFTYLES